MTKYISLGAGRPMAKDVDYPFAELRRRQLKDVPIAVLDKLARPAEVHVNQGSWCVDGAVAYVGLRLPSAKLSRKCAQAPRAAILGYNWPTNFGRVFSFSLVVPGVEAASCCRTLVPYADSAIQVLRDTGRVVIIMISGNQALAAFDADFLARPGSRRRMLEVMAYNDAEDAYEDFDAAYWSLHAYSREKWADRLEVRDNLSLDWVQEYHILGRFLKDTADRARQAGLRSEFTKEILSRHAPLLQELALAALDNPDPRPVVRDILCRSESHEARLDQATMLFWDCCEIRHNCQLAPDEVDLVQALQYFVALDPRITACGRELFWVDTYSQPGKGRTLRLDAELLGRYRNPGFWAGASWISAPINIGHHLSGDECLADLNEDLGVHLAPGITLADAEKQSKALLAEATAARQWTIPWGALVDFSVGVFRRVEIFEVLDDFCFHIWTQDDYCVLAFVGRLTGNWSFVGINEANENTPLQVVAVQLLLASIVRDFCVVEERERVFRQSTGSRWQKRRPDRKRVIYLPRIRYVDTVNVEAMREGLAHTRRAPHFVVGHLRKVESRSVESERLAHAYGFTLKPGYTFVRPHQRGIKLADNEEQIYRSRSALELMCGNIEGTFTGIADWFKFELDIKRLMERLGFSVHHQAANRSGDGGVDIYAEDSGKGESWAIQCKCYRPDRKIGPAIIRELIGALSAYPAGTKGMLITTCGISSDARALSVQAGILLIDGQDLAGMLLNRH